MVGPRNDPMESSKNVLEFPLTLALLEAWSLGFDKGLLKKNRQLFRKHIMIFFFFEIVSLYFVYDFKYRLLTT